MSNDLPVITNEYTLVNDDVYLGSTGLPAIVQSQIVDLVTNAFGSKFAGIDTLSGNLLTALDSLQVAENTYAKFIVDRQTDYDSMVATYETWNATFASNSATIQKLDFAYANINSVIAGSLEAYKAEFNNKIKSEVDMAKLAYASSIGALATSIDSLSSVWESQDGRIDGYANATQTISTYIGYDPTASNRTLAESMFSYNSTLKLGEYYYDTGFGLKSSIKLSGKGTAKEPFSSEFWIKANSFKLVDPDNNNHSPFYVDNGVVYLQNVVIGNTSDAIADRVQWNSNTQYRKLDKVKYNGLNYVVSVDHVSSSTFDKSKVRPDFVPRGSTGVTVSMAVDTPLVIEYNKDGSITDNTITNVTYTASTVGYVGTVYYEWYVNEVYNSTTTTNTLSLVVPSSFKSSIGKVRVYAKTVQDQLPAKKYYLGYEELNVTGYREGSTDYSIVWDNGTNSVSASAAGEVEPSGYTGTGVRVSVFHDSSYLTPEITSDGVPTQANHFSVKYAVKTGNVTIGTRSIVGNEIVYSDIANLTTNSCIVIYTITVKDSDGDLLTFDRQQTIVKSKTSRSTLKSTVFARTKLETLPVPTGGNFKSPIPTSVNSDGSVWRGGIPDGKKPLWSCTRIFTDDGLGTQQEVWTTPQLIANTLQSKTQFSVNGANGWHDTASSGDYFMRTCTSDDGGESWSCNSAVKVKGEDGSDGAPGANGKSVSTGFVYWTSTTTTPSSKPSSGSYNPTTGVVTASVGWNMEPPTVTAGATQASIYYSAYTVLEQDDGSFYVTFKDLKKGTEFSGLVTFTSADDRYADKNLAGVTTIDGDKVITNHITLGTNGQIKSNNFVSGSAGWCIKGNGDIAEFKDVKIYGNIIDSDTDPRFMLGDGGRFLTAASIHAGVPSGDVKLKIDSNANIRLNSDGTARFTKHLNVGPKGAFYASKEGTIGCMYWTSSTQELKPYGTSGTYNLGSPSNQWGTVFADTSSISTSDARKKTDINALNSNELKASIQLSKEFGTFQFLNAIKDKGSNARLHIGMTVQRAIEIMKDNHLDPFAYGFICYDEAGVDELGNNYPDSYGFRYEELLAFISIGFEARLTQLEKGI
jgi:hypothetical protein